MKHVSCIGVARAMAWPWGFVTVGQHRSGWQPLRGLQGHGGWTIEGEQRSHLDRKKKHGGGGMVVKLGGAAGFWRGFTDVQTV